MNIDNQNKIPFTLLQNIKKCGRYTGFIVVGFTVSVVPCWNKLALCKNLKNLHAKFKNLYRNIPSNKYVFLLPWFCINIKILFNYFPATLPICFFPILLVKLPFYLQTFHPAINNSQDHSRNPRKPPKFNPLRPSKTWP